MSINRAALTPFPALAVVMGTAYLIGDPERTAGVSFDAAKAVAPMHAWGLVYLAGASVLTVALILGRRVPLTAALFVGGVIYTWWGACFAAAALADPHASATGWAIHGLIAFAHFYAASRTWSAR